MNPAGSDPHAAIGYTSLVGGEAVPIDLRVARIGSRTIAFALDLLIEVVALGLLFAVIGNVGLEPAAAAALAISATVIVLFGYPTIMETSWGGRTLGKAAMGLRATRDDGGPLRFRHALVRALTRYLVDGFPPLLGLPGVGSMLMSSDGKRLGDQLAGTLVLQSRIPHIAGQVSLMPPPLAGWATTLDLSRLPDALALQCRQFLGRAHQLSTDARDRLGAALVAAVQSVVTPPPPPGTPGWAYISAVLAERRRREEMRMQPLMAPVGSFPAAVNPLSLTKAPEPAADVPDLRPSDGFVPPI